jgi:hypothetical protein
MIKTELLYISSKNRVEGTIGNFYVRVPNNMMNITDRKGFMKISAANAVINRSWYSVGDSNNTFTVSDGVTSTTYDIPEGYSTVKTLRSRLEELLQGWTIAWDKRTNKFTLQPPPTGLTYTLTFNDYSCELFGFNCSTEPSGSFDNPIVSEKPIRINRESSILIHTDLPRLENEVVDNIFQSNFCESDILIQIPISVAPFDNIVYNASANDLFSFVTSSTNINGINVYVTDENGKQLDLHYDWTLTLKVEYIFEDIVDNESTLEANIEKIKDYMRYLILMNEK